ncbi:MAG: hypothetical protein IH621_12795 [Krumholzibacteria bacterium]|nr:hypothetical protein [Candidatus Krumholzibacteria bacterium]
MKRPIPILAAAVAMTACAAQAFAFSSGPPNRRTNAPGETNCTACHASFPLNSGLGSLTVGGVPAAYEPGAAYDVTITLADPNAQRWGFEFTVLGADTNSIGTLVVLDADVQLSTTLGRTYAKHTSVGTHPGTAVAHTWTVRWTAPPVGAGDATLYVAGNAANGNLNATGDRIYAASTRWTEGGLSAVPDAAMAHLGDNYPNPFNPRTTIRYALEEAAPVRLTVYGVDGRLVRRLEDGRREAGEHRVAWDGLDTAGRAVPSGTYLYRLEAGPVRETRTMTLLR